MSDRDGGEANEGDAKKRAREEESEREVGREYNRVIEMEETVQLGRLGFRWV